MAVDIKDSVTPQDGRSSEIVVWDLLIRIGHWLVVLFFFAAYFTEDDLLTVHSWAGYGVGIYVVTRVVWGFLGSKHARFSDFAYGPKSAVLYLRDMLLFRAKRHIGHSPAGAVMVFALLISLAATTATGIALLAVQENAGPLSPWFGQGASLEMNIPESVRFTGQAYASDDDEERNGEEGERSRDEKGDALKEIHEFLSNLTLFLVIIHIGGVVLASFVHRENLARAMITGRKRS